MDDPPRDIKAAEAAGKVAVQGGAGMTARWALAALALLFALEFVGGWIAGRHGEPLTCTPGIIASYAYGLAGGGQ